MHQKGKGSQDFLLGNEKQQERKERRRKEE
jgi:hypothetical protein